MTDFKEPKGLRANPVYLPCSALTEVRDAPEHALPAGDAGGQIRVHRPPSALALRPGESEHASGVHLETLTRQLADAEADRRLEHFLTLKEVAQLLGLSERTLHRKIAAGLIRKAPLGGRAVRISSQELRRLAEGEPLEADPEKSSI